MQLSLDARDLVGMLWRRKWFFLLPTAAIIALLSILPPIYR